MPGACKENPQLTDGEPKLWPSASYRYDETHHSATSNLQYFH